MIVCSICDVLAMASFLQTMQITILTYLHQKFTLEVEASDKVEDVKRKIQDKIGIPPDKQKLCYALHEIQDSQTMNDCNIQEGKWLVLMPNNGK